MRNSLFARGVMQMHKLIPFAAISLAVIVIAVLLFDTAAGATERILLLRNDIIANSNSTAFVKETVRITCENKKVIHGIYREYPTLYFDEKNRPVRVDLQLASVKRDGKTEPCTIDNVGDSVHLTVGSEDATLKPGEYTYELSYIVNQLYDFSMGECEINWNVTDNFWDFPIEKAVATVELPAGVPQTSVNLDTYTSTPSSKGKDCVYYIDKEGYCTFETREPLNPKEGFIIKVSFPKSYVEAPDKPERPSQDESGSPSKASPLIATVILIVIIAFVIGFFILNSRRYRRT
jgi:hypothetical protein